MKAKICFAIWLVITVSAFCLSGLWVHRVDPYFHYHKPELDKYYYPLNNQRSQNDGISRHFEYDALISGTSMAANFKTSELDELFGVNSVKVTFDGGSYKEVSDNIRRALEANPNLKVIVRSFDLGNFFSAADDMRTDLGRYPTYLYDNNPFNDIEYLLNRDILFSRVYPMTTENDKKGFKPGITSFDDYSRWQDSFVFGIDTVCPDGITIEEPDECLHLTDSDKEMIKENIEKNITGITDEYPEVDFYYFYTPYSMAWWSGVVNEGKLYKRLEAEKYITELVIPHENIHLFSFFSRHDILEDLNNYKDPPHYGAWVNSLILKWMHDGRYQLTKDNYEECLEKEYEYFTTFDYESINGQDDYEADYYAAALLNSELTDAKPLDLLNDNPAASVSLSGAEYIDENGEKTGIVCKGHPDTGASVKVNLDGGYNYLSFSGQRVNGQGQPAVYIYDDSGKLIRKTEENRDKIDNEKHNYVLDLSAADGDITIVFNGGYTDETGSDDSEYIFSDIILY